MLLQDYFFIREKLPDTVNLGLFHVDLKEFKSRAIENIETIYVAKLEECTFFIVILMF